MRRAALGMEQAAMWEARAHAAESQLAKTQADAKEEAVLHSQSSASLSARIRALEGALAGAEELQAKTEKSLREEVDTLSCNLRRAQRQRDEAKELEQQLQAETAQAQKQAREAAVEAAGALKCVQDRLGDCTAERDALMCILQATARAVLAELSPSAGSADAQPNSRNGWERQGPVPHGGLHGTGVPMEILVGLRAVAEGAGPGDALQRSGSITKAAMAVTDACHWWASLTQEDRKVAVQETGSLQQKIREAEARLEAAAAEMERVRDTADAEVVRVREDAVHMRERAAAEVVQAHARACRAEEDCGAAAARARQLEGELAAARAAAVQAEDDAQSQLEAVRRETEQTVAAAESARLDARSCLEAALAAQQQAHLDAHKAKEERDLLQQQAASNEQQLKNMLDAATTAKADAEALLTAAQDDLSSARAEKVAADTKAAALEKRLSSAISELEGERSRVLSAIDSAKRESARANELASELARSHDKAASARNKWKAVQAKMAAELEDLQLQVARAQADAGRTVAADVATLRTSLYQQTQKTAAAMTQVASLKKNTPGDGEPPTKGRGSSSSGGRSARLGPFGEPASGHGTRLGPAGSV
eukprot:jgi/Botrbrau1/13211/Bobra.9_1s0003.1